MKKRSARRETEVFLVPEAWAVHVTWPDGGAACANIGRARDVAQKDLADLAGDAEVSWQCGVHLLPGPEYGLPLPIRQHINLILKDSQLLMLIWTLPNY